MTHPIEGGCACGDIRYRIEAAPLGAGQCYCRDCQYATGGGPASAFVVPRSAVKVLCGEPGVWESSTAKGNRAFRAFCRRCGSPVWGGKSSAPEMLAIMAGTVDDPQFFQPAAISWAATAPPWARLDPRLTRFERDIG